MDFLFFSIGSVLPIMRILRLKNTCHLIACILPIFHFFCIHIEKDIRRNWAKSSYASLHSDEQTREFVCMKNGRINVKGRRGKADTSLFLKILKLLK